MTAPFTLRLSCVWSASVCVAALGVAVALHTRADDTVPEAPPSAVATGTQSLRGATNASHDAWQHRRLFMSASERAFHAVRWRALQAARTQTPDAALHRQRVATRAATRAATGAASSTAAPAPRALVCSRRGGVRIDGTRLERLAQDAAACR